MKPKATFLYYLVLAITFFFFSCDQIKDEPTFDFEMGKNRFELTLEEVQREYYLHVPESYTGDEEYPVVFMLHGTSGDGQKFYNISGWKELGEEEGILTVYPSSMRYCILDEGVMKNTTKWNSFRNNWEFCQGEEPKDDILFFKSILEDLKDRLRYDEKRVYLAGFSNGGVMAAKCAFEMSDVFAAITENSGTFNGDSVFSVNRMIPIMLQFGNKEDGFLAVTGGSAYPLSEFKNLLDSLPHFQTIIETKKNTFQLSSQYELTGDTSKYVTARFLPLDISDTHEFQIRLVNKMTHMYPNGTNHPLKGAEVQWEWMKQFSLD